MPGRCSPSHSPRRPSARSSTWKAAPDPDRRCRAVDDRRCALLVRHRGPRRRAALRTAGVAWTDRRRRACTAEIPSCGTVELGATWLHGTRGNAALELAQSLGLVDSSARRRPPEPEDDTFGGPPKDKSKPARWLREDGVATDHSAVRAVRSTFRDALEAVEESDGEDDAADANVGEKLRRARARLVGDETPPDAALVDAVWRWPPTARIDGCGDLDEQGLHAYNYEELGGSHLPVRARRPASLPRLPTRAARAARVDSARHARRRRRVERRQCDARVRRR